MKPMHDHPVMQQLQSISVIADLRSALFFKQLSTYINELINYDFDYLITLLYRIDVDEKKVRALLADEKETAAGEIIAQLIIERQEQKIKSKEQFKPPTNIPEEEKW